MDIDNREELAIMALTMSGSEIGRRLRALLPDSHLYLPHKFVKDVQNEFGFDLPAANLIKDIFNKYRQLVLIMAVGIAVRRIAGEVNNKHSDAAVVVLDDAGKFAVSLLSGHTGGANELTGKIASLMGAQPVITTASDNRGIISPDMLGKLHGWEIEDGKDLTRVSAAMVNEEPVGIYQDTGETDWITEGISTNYKIFSSMDDLIESASAAAVIITDRTMEKRDFPMPSLIYRPKRLVLGIGCNRGTTCEQIESAVNHVFTEFGLSMKCIKSLSTIDVKKNEVGILQYAEKYQLPIEYFSKETLANTEYTSPPSTAALKHVGTPTVCEAAAVLCGGGNLIIPKVSFNRTVTLAVVRMALNNTEKRKKLFIVGIGPGDMEQMTFRARQAIAESDVVVGYHTYIDQIKAFLHGKKVIATTMGHEVERVNNAVRLALKGKTVSLISGGDSGVYGMAGLVGEILLLRGSKLAVEVIPGVPAMVAAGSLLGAPLNGDVASISLSDHLVPWQEIVQRLNMAAKADFVIVLYNPRSKNRRNQLEEARRIILQYRSAITPVGIVTNAYRPDQEVFITDLEHMMLGLINMNTTIVIGNSTTLVNDGWMITPRGYGTKYKLEIDNS